MVVSFVAIILSVSRAVIAVPDNIQCYNDSDLSVPTTTFADGVPVYFTVSDGATAGGTATATVTNGKETVSMSIYDDGTYPDKTADDGVYTGHFRVSTIMTIDVPSRPSQPKIVDCIHIEGRKTAKIEVDLDGGGKPAAKEIRFRMLFDLRAASIKDTSAVIVWTTSVPATSRVEYGQDATYGNASTVDTNARLHHRVVLDGLTSGATYHYRALSDDVYDSAHASSDLTFTTLTAAEVESAIKSARADGALPGTYYVKPDGDDANDGLTTATAWRHIAHAVQQSDAGDTVYVLPGTYTDEHVEFPRNGVDIAPIRLLAFSDKPTLDGVDKTGAAIKMKSKSHIEIAGLRIINYETGIRGEGLVRCLHIHGFEMENINKNGLDLNQTSVQDCRFTDFAMSEIGLDSGTAITHFDYSKTDTYNVEIADFAITNAHGEAINWRNSRRVHIHHGTIKNSGSDAVHYQLNVHCSAVSDMRIETTGWHGIAVHDHTVGDHPCYNNLIRDCYVYDADHCSVDLHSGAFNTVVENCTLVGPKYTTGIYLHNLGAGLLARNNTIKNMHWGLFCGHTNEGFFVSDVVFENNVVEVTQRYGGCAWSDKENRVLRNVKFINNTFIRCSQQTGYHNLVLARVDNAYAEGNRFIEPALPDEPQIRVTDCTGDVIIQKLKNRTTKICAENTTAEVRFAVGKVFAENGKGSPQRRSEEGKYMLTDETIVVNAYVQKSSHPRLFFSEGNITAVRAKMEHPATASIWREIETKGRKFADDLPGYMKTVKEWQHGEGFYHLAWSIPDSLGSTAFVYALTGDEKCAQFAKAVMLDLITWDTWSSQIYHTRYKLKVGLRMGRIALGMGVAYDLIYPALSEDERARIRAGILKLGIQPVYDEYVAGKRKNFLCNWMGVNVGGAGVCALAIAGDDPQNPEEMEPYITGFLDRYKALIDHTVGVNGAYGEGVGYLSYGFEITPYLVLAAREAAGVDFFKQSNLRDLWTYPAYMMSPSKKGYANIGDCEYAMGVADHIYSMCAQATSSGHAQWFFHNGKNFTAGSGLTNFMFYDPDLQPEPPDTLPTSRYFSTFGTAVFRTGWNPEDIFFVFYSGPVHTHGHIARNHFILEAFGEPLAIDMGDGGTGYNNPLYKTYYRRPVAHNLVLVDNNQYSQAYSPGGETSDFVGSKYYDSIVGDAHLCCETLSENRREVVFIKPHYFVILDRLASSKPVEFNWLLHAIGKGNITVDGDTVTVKKGEARLAVKFLEPVGFGHKILDGHKAMRAKGAEGKVETEYISVDTPSKVEECMFLSVLYPYKNGGSFTLPPISKLSAGNALGVKVERDNATDWTLFARSGAGINVEGLATDGVKCALSVTAAGMIERYSAHRGSYLKFNGKTLFSAEGTATIAFGSLEKDCLYGFADVAADTSIAIFVESSPLDVKIDEIIVEKSYDETEKLLTLKLKKGAHQITIRF